MRRGLLGVGLLLICGCASNVALPEHEPLATPATAAARADEPRCHYRVLRVIDGDTIEIVDGGGIRTRVRLRRVNAPELSDPRLSPAGKPVGIEARDRLSALLLGKLVHITPHARDKYGRLVATVELAEPN